MATPIQLAEEHRRALTTLVTLADADMLTLYTLAEQSGSWASFATAINEGIPQIGLQYANVAGIVAEQYYSLQRDTAEAAVTKTYKPYAPVSSVPEDKVYTSLKSSIGYGLKQAYEGAASQHVKEILAGGLNNTVFRASDNVIMENSTFDDSAQVYRRVPSANACAFCKDAALNWASDYYEEGWDTDYHAHCKCVIAVRFDSIPEIDFRQQNLEEYAAKREEAIKMIEDGEAVSSRTVKVGTAEYEKAVKADLKPLARENRKAFETEWKLAQPERTRLRASYDDDVNRIASKLGQKGSLEALTNSEIRSLKSWGYDLDSIGKPLHKPLTTTNTKDILSVMRTQFGYR